MEGSTRGASRTTSSTGRWGAAAAVFLVQDRACVCGGGSSGNSFRVSVGSKGLAAAGSCKAHQCTTPSVLQSARVCAAGGSCETCVTDRAPVLSRVQGSYLYPDMSLYTGGWRAGKKHGQGEAARLGSKPARCQRCFHLQAAVGCRLKGVWSLLYPRNVDCISCRSLLHLLCRLLCCTRHLLGQCWRLPAWQLGVGQPQGAGAVRPAALPL
jgi:hypothetical protein